MATTIVKLPPAATEMSQTALAAAKRRAELEAQTVDDLYRRRKLLGINDWQSLIAKSKVKIPANFTAGQFDYIHVSAFCRWWAASGEERAAATIAAIKARPDEPPQDEVKATDPGKDCGGLTLLPEQVKVVDAINDALWNQGILRALQDGKGGSGKTFMAAGIIRFAIDNNLWQINPVVDMMPARIIVITRKTVRPQYTAVLKRAGLEEWIASGKLLITSYSQLSASSFSRYLQWKYDSATDKEVQIADPFLRPALVVLDECHALNSPDTIQTQFILAWQKCQPPIRFVHMSATPFVTVNHARTFIVNSGLEYPGVGTVTERNYKEFAGMICKKPQKANKRAAKDLRKLLADRIFSLPHVKWPHKAINQILTVDFEDNASRQRYQQAFEIYLEAKRRAGERADFGEMEKLVALGQFRKAAEPERNPAMCRLVESYLKQGHAPVIGACYRETVANLVFRLNRDYGIPRSRISLIWGGKRKWREDLLLTSDEMSDIMKRARLDPDDEDFPSDEELRALKETIGYKTEQAHTGETEDEQRSRLQQMSDLGLIGTQSARARQYEIDQFQSGATDICIFTLAAGGVGLSMDQDKPFLKPRVGFFTPSYSGPEFQQALFRLIRRMTLSDVHQFLVYLKGTIEETHVAPKVDQNLKCLAAITGAAFSLLDFDTAPTHHLGFRSADDILRDAESDAARAENVELIGDGDDDDDGDDD